MNVAELREFLEECPDSSRVAIDFGTVDGSRYGGELNGYRERDEVVVLEAESYPVIPEVS